MLFYVIHIFDLNIYNGIRISSIELQAKFRFVLTQTDKVSESLNNNRSVPTHLVHLRMTSYI